MTERGSVESERSMLRKILVPSDFSPASEAAREYATFLAEPFGAAVDLLYVWTQDERAKGHRHIAFPQQAPLPLEAEGAPPSERKLRVSCRGRVEVGALCATVLRVVEAEAIDLIVMGRGARSRLSRFFRREHAWRIARLVPCPVVVVGPGALPWMPSEGDAVSSVPFPEPLEFGVTAAPRGAS